MTINLHRLGARRAFGLAIGLAWSTSAGAATAGVACPAAATIGGDPELSATLQRELAARGVEGSAATGCELVHATVARSDTHLRVSITDPAGRTSERLVSDVASAATLIETWTHPELSDPILHEDVDPTTSVGGTAPPVTARMSFALTAALESSLGSDGSVWGGAALTASAGVGHACAGVTLRFSNDAEFFGDAARFDADRAGIEILGTADFPFHVGRVLVSPGLAIGAGWMRARSPDPDMDHVVVDDDHIGLRTDAHAGVYFPLADGVQLYLSAAAAFVPLAHGTTDTPGEPFVIGEPRAFLRLGAGLAYGAWR